VLSKKSSFALARTLTLFSIISLGAASLAAPSSTPKPANVIHGLPGKSVKLEEATAKAELIVTGVLLEPGLLFPTGAGFATHEGAEFKVTKVIQGTCGDEIKVRVVVIGMAGDKLEDDLVVGDKYLLLIKTRIG